MMAMKKLLFVLALLVSASWSQVLQNAAMNSSSMDDGSVLSIKEMVRIRDSIRAELGYVEIEDDSLVEARGDSAVKSVNPAIVFAEVMGQNVFVWAWDYYVLDKNYAHTGPSYWKRNFCEGWQWDHNHWAINFYGHPYQGSMYYATARASGYGFYGSLLFAGLGSLTWEMFAETEYPAPNDLIATSIGGSMYGEVLYRLSRIAYNTGEVPWYRHLTSFVLEPAGYVQRAVFGNRDFVTRYVPFDLKLALGAGSRFGSDYRIGNHSADNIDRKWNDHHSMIAASLEYGKPYTKVNRPFDYFVVDVFGEWGFEGNVLQMDVMGKLLNDGVHGRGHWLDFAINLDYDTFYGDLATVSTISLGGSIDLALWSTPSLRFRIMNQINLILLGTADMGYDDLIKEVHPEYNPDKDSYQYNTGVKYGLLMEFWYKKKARLFNKVTLDAMKTIPGSTPHYGCDGWDFLLLNKTAFEYRITPSIDLGSRLDTYVKLAAYSSDLFEPMSRRIFTTSLYFNFHLVGN